MEDKKEEDNISVLIVDDHKIMRRVITRVINGHSETNTVGIASDGEEAIQMARKISPQIILMDINMPVMDGIEATKKIKATMPKVCIIGLSRNNKKEVINRMKQAGASAYLNKRKVSEKLVDLIEKEARLRN